MRRAVPLLAWSAVSCSGLHVAARAPHVAARAPFIRRAVFLSTSRGFNPDKYFTMERPVETRDYIMQQTMIRVKDPEVSLKFYCEVLGFNLVMYRDFPQYEFTVFFVAQVSPALIPKDPEEQWRFCMQTPGCIELTHNYGTETAPGRVYNTGNSDMTGSQDGQKVKGGFGHIGITVPDVCKWSAFARSFGISSAPINLTRLWYDSCPFGRRGVRTLQGTRMRVHKISQLWRHEGPRVYQRSRRLSGGGAASGSDDHQAVRLQRCRCGRRTWVQGQLQIMRRGRRLHLCRHRLLQSSHQHQTLARGSLISRPCP